MGFVKCAHAASNAEEGRFRDASPDVELLAGRETTSTAFWRVHHSLRQACSWEMGCVLHGCIAGITT